MKEFLFGWPGQIALAFAIDYFIGDPQGFFHPVRWIGRGISWAEPRLRRMFSNPKVAGVVLAVGMISLVGVGTAGLIALADFLSPWFGIALRICLFYWAMSTRCLAVEVGHVLSALASGNMGQSRYWLSQIVGRDTKDLDQKDILRATIETTAESTVDGIVSVLIYSFLGGPVLAMIFKTISTLDSMVGYKNERYEKFGWASAKLDDAANFVGARLGALIICVAATLLKFSGRRAMRIVLRDAKLQPSPNSGYPEAAFAGALGLRLGGQNRYEGRFMHKAFLGDSLEEITLQKVKDALRLMWTTSFLSLFTGEAVWALASFL